MWVRSLGQEDSLEDGVAWQPTPVFLLGKSHRGAWQATVHRVTKSWTQLKQLSMQEKRVDAFHRISLCCIFQNLKKSQMK